MRIGYACLTVGVPDTAMKGLMMKNADEASLVSVIAHNLNCLENMVEYNIKAGIRLFRISSDLIPFGSSPVNTLPWREMFASRMERIGGKIKSGGIRVSMHPGQYTVLNSPDEEVAQRAAEDLLYHARVLEALGTNSGCKIILHAGGVYGDRRAATWRFAERFTGLDSAIKSRLVLENDDRSFCIADVMELGGRIGSPVVFDNLHNACNPSLPEKDDSSWIAECAKTWHGSDGPQKIHYSQQDPRKKPGAHSETVRAREFMDYIGRIGREDIDIMLEVKDKNLSAIKCINCVSAGRAAGRLEREWARYKYTVLERAPSSYHAIRQFLKDKENADPAAFYEMLDDALTQPVVPGNAVNAASHVWGYFKYAASNNEKESYRKAIAAYQDRKHTIRPLKRLLLDMSVKYDMSYLTGSYYFAL